MHKTGAVVLVGPMGVGKTTIGKKLAKRLGIPFIDTDALITKLHGEIPLIFAEHGESVFRQFEEACVLEAIAEPAVVATGGGAILSEHTRAALAETKVVYLSTDGKHMASRLAGGNRPLLKDGLADWRRIYESRRELYEQVADLTVDTSGSPLKNLVEQIANGLEKID
jgi:shikimate kinase